MNMIFSKVRVERNVQRFQEKRKNGMNAKFSAKCVALVAAGAMSMSLAACSGGSMDDSSSSNGSAANSDTITLGSVTTNSGTAAAYGEPGNPGCIRGYAVFNECGAGAGETRSGGADRGSA